MIVVSELAVAAAGSGVTHAPGNDSVIVGPRLKGRSAGQPSVYGIAVSVLRPPCLSTRRARESTPLAPTRAAKYRSPLRTPQRPKLARSTGTRSRRAQRHQAPQRIAADRSSTGVLHRVSLRTITMPAHPQSFITCDTVGADALAVAYLHVIDTVSRSLRSVSSRRHLEPAGRTDRCPAGQQPQ